MFFNNLPVAVFPVETYDILRQIQQKPRHLEKIEFIRSNIFPLLSYATILLLRYVCGLLVDISKNKDKNLMTSHNLAVMFAPNLVHSGNPILDVSMCTLVDGDLTKFGVDSGGVGILMKLAIEHFDLMFEGYGDTSNRIRREVENEKAISLSDKSKGDNNDDDDNKGNKTKKITTMPAMTMIATPSTSTPPKYPSIKRMRSLTAMKTLLSTMNTTTATNSSLSSFSSSPTSSFPSPPLFPSLINTMTTTTTATSLCNSDPFRVGAGVEISGIKVQGMVSLSNNISNYNYNSNSNSNGNSNISSTYCLRKARSSIDELRRANSFFY